MSNQSLPTPDADSAGAGIFQRIKRGLSKTGGQLSSAIGNLVLGKKEIDQELLDALEARLLSADMGVDFVTGIIARLTESVSRKELTDPATLSTSLQSLLCDNLKVVEQPLQVTGNHKPFVLLVVGVNGVGKTTTIGKLAHYFQVRGKSVAMAAGDTFRAAAVEQLQDWGRRYNIPVIAQHTGADSASVIFDAIQSARARDIDVVIADTAGRLHNKNNLMEELKKVVRVIQKLDPAAPHEVLLVVDGGTGQNALAQVQQFLHAVKVSGLVVTKLDGTARGGVVFALAKKYAIPVRFIGVGEGVDDLQPFVADDFVRALFTRDQV